MANFPAVDGQIMQNGLPEGEISEYMVCSKQDAAALIASFVKDVGSQLPAQKFSLVEYFTQAQASSQGGEWYAYASDETRRAWGFVITWNDKSQQVLYCQQFIAGQIDSPGQSFIIIGKNGPIVRGIPKATAASLSLPAQIVGIESLITTLQQQLSVLQGG